MLKTLPSILTAPAQAAAVALSGKAVRLDPDAGTGFARLMQQQADLRQSDLRLAQQREASGRSAEPRPVAPAPAAPAQPAESRPATADGNASSKPLSAPASPAQSARNADKPIEADSQNAVPPRTATATAQPAGSETAGTPAGAAGAGSSPAAGSASDSRGATSQSVNATAARARHAALAGWRPTAADGAAARAGAPPPGGTQDDSDVTLDPTGARGFDDPVPAPDSSLASTLPSPAPTALLAADPNGPGPISGAALSAPASAALPVVTVDEASAITAGAADSAAARGIRAESTAGWVAAQQRQRGPIGDAAGAQDSALGAASTAADPDDTSSRMRRSAAAGSTAVAAPPSAAASHALVTAEAAPTGATLQPAATATAPKTATAAAVAGPAGRRMDPPEVATERGEPRFDGGPDAADSYPGAPDTGTIAAARNPRSQPGDANLTPAGSPALTTTLRRSETRPDRIAVEPAQSSPTEAVQAAAAAPQRPDAALPPGVSGTAGAALPANAGPAQRVAPEAAGPTDRASLTGATRQDGADPSAGSPDTRPADGTANTRRTPGLPAEAVPATPRDPLAIQIEGKAVAASVATPAQAASVLAGSGADMPGGPRRSASADRRVPAVGDDAAPDAVGRTSADRDTHRPDWLASGAARLESPAPTLPVTHTPNAAASSALQAAVGAETQPRASAGDTAGSAAAVVGVNTAQSATATGGLANTPAAAAAVEARIAVPVDSPAFAPALGAQVSLFAQGGVQTARLQLNPADMGPITVQIALDGNAARVDFQADRAATRDLIEASLPVLAGAMQDAGLTLSGGGVFQQHPGRQPAPEHSPTAQAPRNPPRDTGPDSGTTDQALASRRGTPRGLVDLIA